MKASFFYIKNFISKVLFFLLIISPAAKAQSKNAPGKSKLDSSVIKWRAIKKYDYRKVSLMIGGGRFLTPNGNMTEANSKYHTQGFSETFGFGGGPVYHSRSGGLMAGIAFHLNQRISFSLWAMPNSHKCFEGGKGSSVHGVVIFIPYTNIYNGYAVNEELISNNFVAQTSYVLIPYKELKTVGLEVRAGCGLLLNKFDLTTTLWAYDTLMVYNGTSYSPNYLEDKKIFVEEKLCFGGTFNLQTSIFVGRHFSIFHQFISGIGSKMNISEKQLTVGRTTAYVPKHYEMLRGFSNTFGIGIHFGLL